MTIKMLSATVCTVRPLPSAKPDNELIYEVYSARGGRITLCVYSADWHLGGVYRGTYWQRANAVPDAIVFAEWSQADGGVIWLPGRQREADNIRLDCMASETLIMYGPARALEINPYMHDRDRVILGIPKYYPA